MMDPCLPPARLDALHDRADTEGAEGGSRRTAGASERSIRHSAGRRDCRACQCEHLWVDGVDGHHGHARMGQDGEDCCRSY